MSEHGTIPFHHKSAGRRVVLVISEHHDEALAYDPAVGIEPGESDVTIHFADSVDAARNLIRSECPDVVVVDTDMLGRSTYGIELEGWLSECVATRGLRVVWARHE